MRPVNGQRIARRRITRNGDALTVIMPRPFLYAMQLRRGDFLELRLFPEEQGFRIRPLRDVPRDDLVRWPDMGDQVVPRKLSRFGNGLSVAVPRHFWHALYCFPRDFLELLLADDFLSVWVQPLRARRTRPALPADLLDVAEETK